MAPKQNPKRSTLPSIPTSGAQAFAELHDEIAAVSEDSLIPISVDIDFAHQIPLGAADRIERLMPELEKLPMLDMARIRKLRTYAIACQYAHVLATAPEQADPRLPRLLEEGTKLRQDLAVTAEMLAHFGQVPPERVAAIHSTNGYVELGRDLTNLAIVFEGSWERVKSRVFVTEEKVKRAPALAIELHVVLGAKTGSPIMELGDPQSMRQRAFTLLVRLYEQLRSGVAFLRYRHGDADQLTPSIFVKQRRRSTAVEPEPPEKEEEEEVTEEPESKIKTPTVPSTTVRPLVPSRLPITELEPTG